jgi:hypothetical protein
MVYIVAVHMIGGATHEHIASVRWVDHGTQETGQNTRPEMVVWIDKGGDARVRDTNRDVQVGTVHPQGRLPYIRTHSDGVWTDNLLALPRY